MRKEIIACIVTISAYSMVARLPLLAQQQKRVVQCDSLAYSRTDTILGREFNKVDFFNATMKVATHSYDSNWALRSCIGWDNWGAFHGTVAYFHQNGSAKSVAYFDAGQMIGDQNFEWSIEGHLTSQTDCKEGLCTTNYYSSSGYIQRVQVTNGMRLLYEEERCPDGTLVRKDSVGIPQPNYSEYYCNGNLKLRCSKNAFGAFVGKYEEFHDSGQLKVVGYYLVHEQFQSLPTGNWTHFDLAGTVVLEETY